ncbi:MAG: hypothetical protein JKY20_10745 [Alphaproteobacteria bacterium]|nr:hypothetical protein [Alphaproteobacteria bacterium]
MLTLRKSATLAFLAIVAIVLGGCDEDAAPDAKPLADKAVMTMDLVNIQYSFKNGRHTYGHIRRFAESAGLGVTLIKGRVCVHNGEECAESLVTYRIEAGAVLDQPNHYVATKLAADVITIEYSGKDDNGNPVVMRRTVRVDNKTATVE